MKFIDIFLNTIGFLSNRSPIEINNSGENSEYKLVKKIKSIGKNSVNDVGIYNSISGNILIKSIPISKYNLSYKQLIQEIHILRILNKINQNLKGRIVFPKIIDVRRTKYKMQIVMEYVSGKHLDSLDTDSQLRILKSCLDSLNSILFYMSQKEIRNIPKRSNLLIFITFPMIFIVAMFKIKQNYEVHLKNFQLFFLNFDITDIFHTEYVFAHRNLHSKNILVNNSNRIVVLDPAISSLSQKETDLAIIARYFYSRQNKMKLIKFIKHELQDDKSIRKFTFLTLFYAYQSIIIEDTDKDLYDNSLKYLKEFNLNIYSDFQSHRLTIAERAYSTILHSIFLFQNTFRKIRFFTTVKRMILCYHSVNNSKWRFSTNPVEFESQVNYLTNNYRVVSLNKVSRNSKYNQVAITFDDGYEDIYNIAYPILKKYKIKATVFVLGSSSTANRVELDNDLQLLNKKQILELYNDGWEIGYHTATHSNLSKLSHEELIYEIKLSKELAEKELGIKLRYFAYPKGFYNDDIVSIVKDAGYLAAFTIDGGNDSSDRFLISRVPMEGKLSFHNFTALTSWLGIQFSKVFMQTLILKEKLSTKLSIGIRS